MVDFASRMLRTHLNHGMLKQPESHSSGYDMVCLRKTYRRRSASARLMTEFSSAVDRTQARPSVPSEPPVRVSHGNGLEVLLLNGGDGSIQNSAEAIRTDQNLREHLPVSLKSGNRHLITGRSFPRKR